MSVAALRPGAAARRVARMGNLWHPFADMQAVSGAGPLVIDRGEGVHVWDEEGNRYLDATASLWFCNVGYGRQRIVDAAAEQMRRLPAYHTFGDLATRPSLELADRLADLAPVDGSKVFLTSGGSDSIDTAGKLARRYWHRTGSPGRTIVITRELGYHGMHAYGTSIAGIEANLADYGNLVEQVVKVPWDSAPALRTAIEAAGPDRVAAFFCEPVVGAGGVLAPPPGYLKEAREICRETGVLFVADEVITGFGRVGDWFASTRFGLQPDLVTFAKGVTSGYLPLGGVLIAPHLAEPFWGGDGVMWRHGYTYSGHATACAAALANLAIMDDEDLPARALGLESDLEEALAPLAAHPLVSEVRAGLGVMAALQIDPVALADDPSLPARANAAARRAGVLTRAITGGALQISPPLTIVAGDIDEMVTGFRAALDAI